RVRPGADADGIDVGRSDDLAPVVGGPREPELLRGALAGLLAAIGDDDELDAGRRAEPGNVTPAGDPAGADESDSNRLVSHRDALIEHQDGPRNLTGLHGAERVVDVRQATSPRDHLV